MVNSLPVTLMEMLQLLSTDYLLKPYKNQIADRKHYMDKQKDKFLGSAHNSLTDFANGHLNFGCFKINNQVIIREWLPNANRVCLLGDFNKWNAHADYNFAKKEHGVWELVLSNDELKHGDLYKLMVFWDGGEGERIPAWCRRTVQDETTHVFSAQAWFIQDPYLWANQKPQVNGAPLIYEAHVGMSGESEEVQTFNYFRTEVLPRIHNLGYNTLQLMAIQEHPYYGSFGYHVSGFFAVSSRFGTPEELKALVDEAHGMGIRVIMDVVHSHAVKNELEGLGNYDGSRHQFFHEGDKGLHPAWDSYCFNYGKPEVVHFLLSNLKFWLEEYRFDGFRFDGVTSMLYLDHGLERDFTQYSNYFDGNQDLDALTYLSLANTLIKEIDPAALSIAEEMSAYPGLAYAINEGGVGFDYRLAMGIPDNWIKMLKEQKDEDWDLGHIYFELTSKRPEEQTISYAESHDQALVGDKSIAFWLMDKAMYDHMANDDENMLVDRGMALHKMIRLITIVSAGGGYLNFMGNEFGHPEWVDFPREGNNWSYQYATRKWNLVDNELLKYKFLNAFDKAMIALVKPSNLLSVFPINLQKHNNPDKVIAFSRSNYVFIFNFSATQSYTSYGIPVPRGTYKVLLSTDALEFGGQGRIDMNQKFKSQSVAGISNHEILTYLPARTALVLQKQAVPSVH